MCLLLCCEEYISVCLLLCCEEYIIYVPLALLWRVHNLCASCSVVKGTYVRLALLSRVHMCLLLCCQEHICACLLCCEEYIIMCLLLCCEEYIIMCLLLCCQEYTIYVALTLLSRAHMCFLLCCQEYIMCLLLVLCLCWWASRCLGGCFNDYCSWMRGARETKSKQLSGHQKRKRRQRHWPGFGLTTNKQTNNTLYSNRFWSVWDRSAWQPLVSHFWHAFLQSRPPLSCRLN